MIYLNDHINDFDLEQALASVSPQRREQALRYRQERDRRLSVAAYRLLQHALLQEYGINELPQLVINHNGKPSLAGHKGIHFSLSHCREAVACIVGEHPVGIDVETYSHYSEEVAARVMSDEEISEINASVCPAEAFTRLWTMKESLFKLTGNDNDGDIAHMLDDISAYRFTTIVHGHYLCSTCELALPSQLTHS